MRIATTQLRALTLPYKHLKHMEDWLPQTANLTDLEMEQE
ncbi:hypothetical protein KYG_11215 [Acidovorax sp. NO-1]|nr:hypothetical protein KYG_11215 [Acidovorax sp. NO-1]